MSHPEPTITVNVDVTNPGQFFACCGLLELADRLWPGAEVEGSFTSPRFERSRFRIFAKSAFTTREVVSALTASPREAVDPYRPIMGSNGKPVADAKKTKPVLLHLRRCVSQNDVDVAYPNKIEPESLRLSWWLDELAGTQSPFKMWSAHLTSEGLISDMANAICVDNMNDNFVLQTTVGMTSRIGLDTRSSWNTLDEGFSPNDQVLPVDTYAATELLAAIGLETFRPATFRSGHVYACWTSLLPTIVARGVASGSVNIRGISCFHFEVGTRGKFKYFTKASPLGRTTNG